MLYQKKEFLQSLSSLLGKYKHFCDETLSLIWTKPDELDQACFYALQSGGKRFRPALVWMVEEALGNVDWKKAPGPGLACEYFHTASLIADDLPCMDNDDFRRGKPTTHKQFAESTALLGSFALISEGFRAIAQTPLPSKQPMELHLYAISEASRTMGIQGLLGGQMLDMNAQLTHEKLLEMIDKKTGALFELCFLLGWIFGGGSKDRMDEVKSLSTDFGRAFQLIDDLDDYEQDLKANKKNNFAVLYGPEKASKTAEEYARSFQDKLSRLQIGHTGLSSLADFLLALSRSRV